MSDLIKTYQSQIVELSKNYSIFGTPEAIKVYGLGLCEEVGEVVGLLKRYYRGDAYEKEECGEFKWKLCKELGDVTAYLTLVLDSFDLNFEYLIVEENGVYSAIVDILGNNYFNGLNLSMEVGKVASELAGYELDGELKRQNLFAYSQQLIYFVSCIALDFNLTLEQVLEANLSKIHKMVANKTLLGTGDDR
jgi:NTP pyrophosphatase (non-canonical NTP hydrolase)